ncbi:hypothetical protein COT87_02985 [Candidatus Collierbacteria bacterium CG10_big_fil_rev_8_21_14_0_10_44_9]|uniref:UDP-N-acetylmuramoylalanine--D-glutamate ligase n=1 Tax=Candidatus Collierbacteria bacterium CG10_big_fil_rev_8_21_14_0_10_44_9 TaxID=1974535 RepID=A0A2H0VI47_9BACT|nr:MAG: hypothetical protein COT87_02985 [Candidatus Collierbacteria bacterium CG10_big_fil_rev_8_21_14_0_10_44_9]
MNTFANEIRGKKVLVFGLGRQGGGAGDLLWLKHHGAIVRASDKDLSLVPEGQTREQIDWAEIIIKNPGVPDNHELIIYAKLLGKPILTSIAIFVKYCGIKTLGVTGTRGKTTTVALITTLLEQVFPGNIVTGGNIAGTSCLALLDQCLDKKYAVLELSSFQLHNFHELKISPNYAILTNIYPDHLNRYPDMESYQKDKEAIYLYQKPGDVFIKFPNPATVRDWETSLPGLHNKANIAGMFAIGQALGITETICRKVAKDFPGLPFRQEKICESNGISYINDTTSTTPVAALKALEAATGPTIWITGGDSKKLPFKDLLTEVKTNKFLKKIIILGSKNIPDYVEALKDVASVKILGTVSSMVDAVNLARSVAVEGDTILLSPGFASFDLFQNEFDRGRQFNKYAKN